MPFNTEGLLCMIIWYSVASFLPPDWLVMCNVHGRTDPGKAGGCVHALPNFTQASRVQLHLETDMITCSSFSVVKVAVCVCAVLCCPWLCGARTSVTLD